MKDSFPLILICRAKFEHYFDSDDDQSQSSAVEESVGKVSQWKPSPQGKWLQSPTKSRKRCVVASGGNAKYVSPNYRKRFGFYII